MYQRVVCFGKKSMVIKSKPVVYTVNGGEEGEFGRVICSGITIQVCICYLHIPKVYPIKAILSTHKKI